MDEPTEGLAPALVAEVGRLIRQLRQEGMSVLLVEQNAAFAVDVSDVTHVMHQGTIVHSSEPEALWENEEIKSQYLGLCRRRSVVGAGLSDRDYFATGAAGFANFAASMLTFGCTSVISNDVTSVQPRHPST